MRAMIGLGWFLSLGDCGEHDVPVPQYDTAGDTEPSGVVNCNDPDVECVFPDSADTGADEA